MRKIMVALAALLAAGISGACAQAQQQQQTNLNPFRTGADSSATAPTDTAETTGRWITWPKMPSLGILPQRDPTKPTMLQNMRQGVRNSWKRTTSFLNPWSEATPEDTVSQPIGNGASNNFSNYGTQQTETTQRGFGLLPNLFGSSEPAEEPRAQPEGVIDFLNQPRVNYP